MPTQTLNYVVVANIMRCWLKERNQIMQDSEREPTSEGLPSVYDLESQSHNFSMEVVAYSC